MTDQHPITPPPELVKKIFGDALRGSDGQHDYELRLIHAAYAAGADQELEACCAHMRDHQWGFVERPDGTKIHRAVYLQQSRRPKPPSLKAQALHELNDVYNRDKIDDSTYDTILRALEALDD
jgi:hypothetical protein